LDCLVNSSISKPSTFSNTRRTPRWEDCRYKHFVLHKSIACLHRFCFHRWVLISFPCIHTLQADSKQVTLSQTLIDKALISAIKKHVLTFMLQLLRVLILERQKVIFYDETCVSFPTEFKTVRLSL
jgi:hypothetical protein